RFIQRSESAGIYAYLTNQLAVAEDRIREIQVEKQSLSDSGLLSYDLETQQTISDLRKMSDTLAEKKLKYDSLAEQIKSLDEAMPDSRILLAKQELQDMLLTRTVKHPDVQNKQREIENLEKQQQAGTLVKGATGSDTLFVKRMDLFTSGPTLKREIDELTTRISSATNSLYQRKGKDMTY